jgi:hypothetical protein
MGALTRLFVHKNQRFLSVSGPFFRLRPMFVPRDFWPNGNGRRPCLDGRFRQAGEMTDSLAIPFTAALAHEHGLSGCASET